MKIAVIGATGKQGSLLVKEALERKHAVTAFVRKAEDREKIPEGAAVAVKQILDLTANDLKQFDLVIDAFGTWKPETLYLHGTTLAHLADLGAKNKNRLMVVGGAGSLLVDEKTGTRLMDLPDFPAEYLPVSQAMGAAFEDLRKRTDVRWTYVSPSADFNPAGKRTGSYKIGDDLLLTDSAGKSEISYADYAIAMIDEAENARHEGKRITVCGK